MKRILLIFVIVLFIPVSSFATTPEDVVKVMDVFMNADIDELLFFSGMEYLFELIQEEKGEVPTPISDSGIGQYLPSPLTTLNSLFNLDVSFDSSFTNTDEYLSAIVYSNNADSFIYTYMMQLLGWGFDPDEEEEYTFVKNGIKVKLEKYVKTCSIFAEYYEESDATATPIPYNTPKPTDESQSNPAVSTKTDPGLPELPSAFSGKKIKVKAANKTYTLRQDFKDFMDAYEEYFDNYIEFMKSVKTDSPDYLTKYVEFMSQLEKLSLLGDQVDDLTDDETAYATYVMLKIQQKLLAAAN